MSQTTDLPSCDLVLKGGITSGVVYPKALKKLSDHYRFSEIGGTSAGAIAAVFAAAAEYGRDKGGFDKIEGLAEELSTTVLEKFQPVPELAPLFRLLLAAQRGKQLPILWALMRGYPREMAQGAALGLIIVVLALFASATVVWGWLLVGLVVMVAGGLGWPLWEAKTQATEGLAANDYGLCPGRTQKGWKPDTGLSDWMAKRIDEIAFGAVGPAPLTVKMLAERGIRVQTVTTDITTHRPFVLPMRNNLHAFDPEEFARIFPDRIVVHMVAQSTPVGPEWQDPTGRLRYFRIEDLPVVVLARMSLSFPLLISAVPLHRVDHTLVKAEGAAKLRRCLFSDGGLSSNFPVHFFDHVLPLSPTFGISLGEFEPLREADQPKWGPRISLPTDPKQGRLLPTHRISGLAGFVMALFNSAKDWQDSLQSVLTGYRERIVTVNLTEDEGGLNLQMAPETITRLTGFGETAGEALATDFSLPDHQMRRFLTELPALERVLMDFADHWRAADPAGVPIYETLLRDHHGESYDLPEALRAKLIARARRIADLGQAFFEDPLSAAEQGKLPATSSRMRHIADMDTTPRSQEPDPAAAWPHLAKRPASV
ncbi:patatin-like phospholipase family protein [Rhodobacter capsulatus]|uniref:patatin-like phospholipase family protein n=1 Tax=Rhodobacter capsulatus TaxID=1061 RepID=UPI0040269E49